MSSLRNDLRKCRGVASSGETGFDTVELCLLWDTEDEGAANKMSLGCVDGRVSLRAFDARRGRRWSEGERGWEGPASAVVKRGEVSSYSSAAVILAFTTPLDMMSGVELSTTFLLGVVVSRCENVLSTNHEVGVGEAFERVLQVPSEWLHIPSFRSSRSWEHLFSSIDPVH